MLNDDDEAARPPHTLRDGVDSVNDAIGLKPGVFAVTERGLDINDEKCDGHDSVWAWGLDRMASR